MCRFRAFAAVLLLIMIGIFLACKSRNTPPKNPTEEVEQIFCQMLVSRCTSCSIEPLASEILALARRTATINLSTVTNSSQIEVFHKVKQVSLLPSAVREAMGGMADPGQPFNVNDFDWDPKLPWQELYVAAVSENYCIDGRIFCVPSRDEHL